MIHEKIFFLDIDGVLNSLNFAEEFRSFDVLDRDAMNLLKEATEKHHAQLVITSTWRLLPQWRSHIRDSFAKAGWTNPPIIDRTPELTGERGDEIQAWLDANPTKDFIIIDDEDDMLTDQMSHLVQCETQKGLTPTQIDEIERMWG